MKHTLFLNILAAAILGSGVANAGTLYASEYDYKSGDIALGSYDTLVVDVSLTMRVDCRLDLYNGATIEFLADNSGAICSISPSRTREVPTVFFHEANSVFNIAFDDDAQAVIAASEGTPITLIQDQSVSYGFSFSGTTPAETTLKLNGVGYGETVVLDGVSFTYVGPQSSDYTFKAGEIGFTGYENCSHNLSLAHGGGLPTPEPTTGTLSLLALAGLCIRRRK